MKKPNWFNEVEVWKAEFVAKIHPGFEEKVKVAVKRLELLLVARVIAGRFTGSKSPFENGGWSYCIQLNPLMTREQAYDTYGHEFAHFLAWVIDGKDGHGPVFQFWCRVLGFKPEQFHDYGNLLGRS